MIVYFSIFVILYGCENIIGPTLGTNNMYGSKTSGVLNVPEVIHNESLPSIILSLTPPQTCLPIETDIKLYDNIGTMHKIVKIKTIFRVICKFSLFIVVLRVQSFFLAFLTSPTCQTFALRYNINILKGSCSIL